MHESILALLLALTSVSPAHRERIQFVNEYIRELIEVVELRDDAARTGNTDQGGRIADCLKNGTRLQLALEDNVRKMRSVKLHGQYEQSPEKIARIWEQEVTLYKQLTNMCANFMDGPKPGVDYREIEGQAPKLAAKIDYLDGMLFESSPVICDALLIGENDAPGHSRHLLITRKERDTMVATLNSSLPEIDKKSPGYLTSSAKVLKIFVTKSGYRMADEH